MRFSTVKPSDVSCIGASTDRWSSTARSERGTTLNGVSKTILVSMISTFAALVCGCRAWAQDQAPFCDQFDTGELDASRWIVATYQSPDSKPGFNAGTYAAKSLDFSSGMLRISVDQEHADHGMRSQGGAIISRGRFGYGTYEFVMRMTSTSPTPEGTGEGKSGAVSSAFLYRENSETEIDLEFVGDQNAMWVTTWHNTDLLRPPAPSTKKSKKLVNRNLATGFHPYLLIWEPGSIRVLIDGELATRLTKDVPFEPARIILQHRGTNSGAWGGEAIVGKTRYAYFQAVKFTPREGR